MIELNYRKIGRRIRERRKELGLTQKQLGKKVGLSEASISKYETGKVEDATTTKLNEFAVALEADIAWLLGISTAGRRASEDKAVKTIAAHFNGRNISDEQLRRVENFIEFTLKEDK